MTKWIYVFFCIFFFLLLLFLLIYNSIIFHSSSCLPIIIILEAHQYIYMYSINAAQIKNNIDADISIHFSTPTKPVNLSQLIIRTIFIISFLLRFYVHLHAICQSQSSFCHIRHVHTTAKCINICYIMMFSQRITRVKWRKHSMNAFTLTFIQLQTILMYICSEKRFNCATCSVAKWNFNILFPKSWLFHVSRYLYLCCREDWHYFAPNTQLLITHAPELIALLSKWHFGIFLYHADVGWAAAYMQQQQRWQSGFVCRDKGRRQLHVEGLAMQVHLF